MNGEAWRKSWVTWDEVFADGGTLEFELGERVVNWTAGGARRVLGNLQRCLKAGNMVLKYAGESDKVVYKPCGKRRKDAPLTLPLVFESHGLTLEYSWMLIITWMYATSIKECGGIKDC